MIYTYQSGSYKAKLFDRRWQLKRKKILDRDNNVCVICGENKNLVVHHKQYHFVARLSRFRDPWDYNDKYLITLCEKCHKKGHTKYKVPVMNI